MLFASFYLSSGHTILKNHSLSKMWQLFLENSDLAASISVENSLAGDVRCERPQRREGVGRQTPGIATMLRGRAKFPVGAARGGPTPGQRGRGRSPGCVRGSGRRSGGVAPGSGVWGGFLTSGRPTPGQCPGCASPRSYKGRRAPGVCPTPGRNAGGRSRGLSDPPPCAGIVSHRT